MEITPIENLENALKQANIALVLDDKSVGNIAQKVMKEFEIDEGSNAEWVKKNEEAMKLAKQVAEEKNTPWKNASNVKYPLITVASIQFAARAMPALVPDRRVVKGKVIGSDNGIPAMKDGKPIVDKNGNVQFQVPPGAKAKRAQRVADHMSYQFTDEMEEWLDDTDTLLHAIPIVNRMYRKVYFDPEKGRNCTKILWPDECFVHEDFRNLKTAPRINECFKLYKYQIEEKVRAGLYLELDIPEKKEEDELEDFIEVHTRLDLDADGYPEPYIVTMHKESRSVARIVANYDGDSIVRAKDGRILKIVQDEYYIPYNFMPDPEGKGGMGFGSLMSPMNEAVNTLINQLIDAGTLANRGGGFVGRGIRMPKGEIKFKIGEWKTVDVGQGSVRDNVLPMPVKDPSNVLFSLLGLLIDASKDISSVQDIMTGQVQQATQPTTALALIEQGMRVFTGIYKRIHRAFKHEMRLVYNLNRKYLSDREYFDVLDTPMVVARADYGEDIAVVPLSDPTMVSDAARQKKGEIMMGMMGNPFINPMEATKYFLEVIGVEDPERFLMVPDPDPETMEMIQRLENDSKRADATVLETKAKAVQLITESFKNLAGFKEGEGPLPEDKMDKLFGRLLLIGNFVQGAMNDRKQVAGMEGPPSNQGVPGQSKGNGKGDPLRMVQGN